MSKISVIIPAFNQEKYVARCLRSITNQSMNRKDYEIIVINDGSTDNTAKAIDTFKNDIKLIENKKNVGLPKALNIAIKKSKSKYIVRLDSDDYVNTDFLKILYLYIQNNEEVDAAACDYYLVNDNEVVLKRENCEDNPIACGIIFKTKNLIELGLYDEEFLLHEDKDLRQRFNKKFKIYRVPVPLYRYRRHQKNITNDLKKSNVFMSKFKKKYSKI